jgi:hypothetical protein
MLTFCGKLWSPKGGTMETKLDIGKLAVAIRDAHLQECLANECQCVTNEEHAKNVERAKELGLTAR